MFELETYLHYFNRAFADKLGAPIVEKNIPKGDRIVERLERYIEAKKTQLRPSGGFNHYVSATVFARNPDVLDDNSLARFEALFAAINKLFG
ncbi:hypothetical protein KQX64_06730 [Rhodopseudomonas palustris]|nr:hypothetical protein KQX64_06730 [Rhodopseudomonas palustris]